MEFAVVDGAILSSSLSDGEVKITMLLCDCSIRIKSTRSPVEQEAWRTRIPKQESEAARRCDCGLQSG